MKEQQGIALDIDDTLSDSLHFYMSEILKKFGVPKNMSVDDIIQKYKFTALVPEWQTPEIEAWIVEKSRSNDFQEMITVMPGAVEAVQAIHQVVPVRMYITSRPSLVVEGTKRWLEKHGFPEAEVVTRPESKTKIDGNAWKSQILQERYPSIGAIVDDNPEIITALGKNYPGRIYLFGNHFKDVSTPGYVIRGLDWPSMEKAIVS
jgi:phosphoglycolate phosphatase-like HAD superfamily hydrolase